MLLHVHKDRTDCIDNKESFVMSGIKEIMQIDMPQDTSVFILVQDNITICESYAGFL